MVKLHGAVLPKLTAFPSNPSEGRLAFVDDALYVFTDVDGSNSWYPITNRTERHVETIGTASSTWVITHNLNSNSLLVLCYNASGNLVVPSNINYDSTSQITITLPTANSGHCVVFIDVAQEISSLAQDADKLDGLDSSQFLRSDVDDTFDANLTVTGTLSVGGNQVLTDLVEDTTPQLGGNLDLNGNMITQTGTNGENIWIANTATQTAPDGPGGDINLVPGNPDGSGEDGHVILYPGSGMNNAPVLEFQEAFGGGQQYIGLKGPDAITTNRIWTLPDDDPSTANGKFLTTNASGELSFSDVSGGLQDLIEDTTPQLGGNLDLNGFDIVSEDVSSGSADTFDVNLGDVTAGSGHPGRFTVRAGDVGAGASTVSPFGCAIYGSNNLRTSGTAYGGNITLQSGDAKQSASGRGGGLFLQCGDGLLQGGTVWIRPGVDETDGSLNGEIIFDYDNTNAPGGSPKVGWAGSGLFQSTYIYLKAPDADFSTRTWTLPKDDPLSVDGYFLKTNSSGELSFSDVDPFPTQTGNSGKVLGTNGSVVSWVNSGGAGLQDWTTVTSNVTATSGDRLLVDTVAAARTITLPPSPVAGDEAWIVDAAINFGTNNCTLARNGSNIEGVADDYILDVDRADVHVVYVGSTTGWRVIK